MTQLAHSFLYDGERINEDDTPNSLGMEDNGRLPLLFASFSKSHTDLIIYLVADTVDVMVLTCKPTYSLQCYHLICTRPVTEIGGNPVGGANFFLTPFLSAVITLSFSLLSTQC